MKIIKEKAKNIILQSRVPKRIWDFGLVWGAEIYSCTVGEYGRTF